jgi:Type I phosphodiesterase / nucleotide pyrophosphatase
VSKRIHRRGVLITSVAALAALGGVLAPSALAGASQGGVSRHVLLISIDGMHASDLSTCEAQGLCPNLASLAGHGSTYSNAHTSEPSDSAPGLMALVTGGDPKLTGVYYDDSYDRTMYAPPAQTKSLSQDCSGAPGNEAAYFENVDFQAPNINNPNGNRPIIGGSVDPAQLGYVLKNGKCQPVTPNNFLRTNSIFSVAHAAGMYTAWADKHPVYNAEVAGHGTPNAVSDPFNTEINADVIPPSLVDTRGNTVTFPLPNPTGTGRYFITDSVGNTEAYDQIKVDAILNQIDGRNSWGNMKEPVPNIFGMNFQAVSVGQKLVDPRCRVPSDPSLPACPSNYVPGGYEPGSTSANPIFTPQLKGALQYVDGAIGSMVSELTKEGKLASTTIIITAKHGQSPIDPSKLALIGHAETTVLNNAGVFPAMVTDDDVSLIWMNPATQTADTAKGVAALQNSMSHGNPAHIQTLLYGPALTAQFGDPTKDPRTPDIIIQPIPGTIYSSSNAKVMEHGGFAEDDTHVALLTVKGANIVNNTKVGATIGDQVRTYQVAPTILADLGLNPKKLDSVRIEHVQVLPPHVKKHH